MKIFILCIATVLSFFYSPTLTNFTLTLSIPNLHNAHGQLLVQIVNEQNETIKSLIQKIDKTPFELQITDLLPNKNYAIAVVHDENSSGNIDTNFLGIPKEGYGFSNNPKATFGKPALQTQLFSLNQNEKIEIKLIYW